MVGSLHNPKEQMDKKTSDVGTREKRSQSTFHSVTGQGRKQLAVETENRERISGVIRRALRQEAEG